VVDEAHCITQWGKKFRKDYGSIETIRCMLPKCTVFVAQSATMPPHILDDVRSVLCIEDEREYHMNLGNDRRNIAQIVLPLEQHELAHKQLPQLLKDLRPDEHNHLVRALCFFDTRPATQDAFTYLRRLLPDHLKSRVHYIHAGLTAEGRAEAMRRFMAHEIDILLATNAVGLGQNLPDVEVLVVAKMASGTEGSGVESPGLAELVQYIGRAGRDNKPARAYVLVEFTVFQQVKPRQPKKTPGRDSPEPESQEIIDVDIDNLTMSSAPAGDLVFRKTIDADLRAYYTTNVCRRAFMNNYFKNPRSSVSLPLTCVCCDLCVLARLPAHKQNRAGLLAALDEQQPLRFSPVPAPAISASLPALLRALSPPPEEKPLVLSKSIKREKDVADLFSKPIVKWQGDVYVEFYSASSFRKNAILSKAQVAALCNDSSLTNIDNLRAHDEFLDWPFDEQAESLVDVLKSVQRDVDEAARREADKAAHAAEQQRLLNPLPPAPVRRKRKAKAGADTQDAAAEPATSENRPARPVKALPSPFSRAPLAFANARVPPALPTTQPPPPLAPPQVLVPTLRSLPFTPQPPSGPSSSSARPPSSAFTFVPPYNPRLPPHLQGRTTTRTRTADAFDSLFG
jgi:hypothetical protein